MNKHGVPRWWSPEADINDFNGYLRYKTIICSKVALDV